MGGCIQFPDKSVSYESFMNELAARIVFQLKQSAKDKVMISQRKAFEIFGRANVERWRREGRVKFYKRPGKVEYKTADLRILQNTEQDYFKR